MLNRSIMMKKNKYLIFFVCLLLLLGVGWNQFYSQQRHERTTKPTVETSNLTHKNNDIPEKVYEVLSYVTEHKQAMKGYVGGRVFENREKRLPLYNTQQKRIQYREWDVNPKIPGQNRGAERLITGNDFSAWYTRNHYQSFIKIK
jgi:guanyl-specific ribonuclease Sa